MPRLPTIQEYIRKHGGTENTGGVTTPYSDYEDCEDFYDHYGRPLPTENKFESVETLKIDRRTNSIVFNDFHFKTHKKLTPKTVKEGVLLWWYEEYIFDYFKISEDDRNRMVGWNFIINHDGSLSLSYSMQTNGQVIDITCHEV